MANFVLIGNRIINLDLVAAAERDGNGGKVTVYLAAGEGQPMKWVFDKQEESDVLWVKLSPRRGDLTDLRGGPYSITDNETTASTQE